MADVHLSADELARDIHGALEMVRRGSNVVVESDHHPVAVLSRVPGPGRSVDECIAIAERSGSNTTLDDEFSAEVVSF
jgi:hypothetical protein